MNYYGKELSRLIDQLSALPGIGGKTAQRLAFHIVNMPEEQVQTLSETIMNAKKKICFCKECIPQTEYYKTNCPFCYAKSHL